MGGGKGGGEGGGGDGGGEGGGGDGGGEGGGGDGAANPIDARTGTAVLATLMPNCVDIELAVLSMFWIAPSAAVMLGMMICASTLIPDSLRRTAETGASVAVVSARRPELTVS